jgi:hypothetical protein
VGHNPSSFQRSLVPVSLIHPYLLLECPYMISWVLCLHDMPLFLESLLPLRYNNLPPIPHQVRISAPHPPFSYSAASQVLQAYIPAFPKPRCPEAFGIPASPICGSMSANPLNAMPPTAPVPTLFIVSAKTSRAGFPLFMSENSVGIPIDDPQSAAF